MRVTSTSLTRTLAAALPYLWSMALLGTLSAPRTLRAETVDRRLSEARAQFQQLEYERAIRLLRPIARDPTATKQQKIDALELLGLSHLTLGRERAARKAFEHLLRLDPRHKLRDPTGSPKLRQFYEAVQRSFTPDAAEPPRTRARIAHEPPDVSVAGRQLVFRARLENSAEAPARVVVRWRRSSDRAYHTLLMRGRRDRLEARLLAPAATRAYAIDYFIEALDHSGQPLARRGQPERPLELTVAADESASPSPAGGVARRSSTAHPFYTRWWFWTLVGVAVVGGIAATVAALASSGVPEGTLPPGIIDLSQAK